jgi:hypothetical protein
VLFGGKQFVSKNVSRTDSVPDSSDDFVSGWIKTPETPETHEKLSRLSSDVSGWRFSCCCENVLSMASLKFDKGVL